MRPVACFTSFPTVFAAGLSAHAAGPGIAQMETAHRAVLAAYRGVA